MRKAIYKSFTKIASLLPPWKDADAVELVPPLLAIPVSQPLNMHMLPHPFSTHFIPVKHVPNRRIFILEDVYVNGKAIVFKNLRIFLPSLPWLRDLSQYQKGEVLLKQWQGNYRQTSAEETIALIYDDWSANNYYHWMIEALPRLLLVRRQFPDCRVVVPDPAPEYISTSLQMLGATRQILLHRDRELLRVKRLAMPELVYYYEEKEGAFLYNYEPQTKKTKSISNLPAPAPVPDFLAQELIVLVRKHLLNAVPPRTPGRKIYASRSRQKTRRLQNEAQVWPLLEKRGFERVYFEEMSLQEQINVMLEAEIFMGVHGANMVNILFLQPGTNVIEMMNQDHYNEAYYLLASSLGLPYYSIPCLTADPGLREAEDSVLRNDADLVVDGRVIEAVLTGILGIRE